MDTESAPPTPKEKEEKAVEKVETASSWATASGGTVSETATSGGTGSVSELAVEAGDSGSSDSGTAGSGATDVGVAGPEATDPGAGATASGATASGSANKEGGEGGGEKADQAEKKEPEPNFQLLSNPARVLPQQVCHYNAAGMYICQGSSWCSRCACWDVS